jgi:hypothetical protein
MEETTMSRSPRIALALVSCLALTLALAGSVLAGGKPLVATLIPANEPVTGGDPNPAAIGTFRGTFNYGQAELCYTLTASNLSATIVGAHIHVAPAGVNGPIVIPLEAPVDGSSSGCITGIDQALIKAIMQDPSAYYVNVHTNEAGNPDSRPGGAIRGQLAEPEDD